MLSTLHVVFELSKRDLGRPYSVNMLDIFEILVEIMAAASNLQLVGCTEEIEREIGDDFLCLSLRDSVNSNARPCVNDSAIPSVDQDLDIGSDEEENPVEVTESPLMVSRIRRFLSSGHDSDLYNDLSSDEDERDADMSEDENVNKDEKEAVRLAKQRCSKQCLDSFCEDEIVHNRLNVMAMDKDSRDMLIIGHLQACETSQGNTTRKGERKRHRYDYQYNNKSVCKSCYLFVNAINIHYFKNVREHFFKNGAVPRLHGNTGKTPKHAVTFEDVQRIVQFLTRYAEEFGLPQPAAPYGRDGFPPVYLPGNETCKSLHLKYQEACREAEHKILSRITLRRIWKRCIPHIQIMSPRTDVCHRCESFREQIVEAVSETEKLKATKEFTDHLVTAQKEREYYRERCCAAQDEVKQLTTDHEPSLPLKNVHYTFDFAQSVLLPSHCRQEGTLYFRSLYKANLFGICNDGRSQQTNYVFGEDHCMGLDGSLSHSANSVVSMLDHYLSNYGEKERMCYFNADNCGGQNKNQVVTSYFAWRVATGAHDDIHLHFMKPYHARCLVDGMFGLARRKIRRYDYDSIQDVVNCICESSQNNHAISPSSDKWQLRDWKSMFKAVFRAVPGIQQYHHFHFSSAHPGIVKVKKNVDSEAVEIRLLKRGKVTPTSRSIPVEPAGLSPSRSWYLFKNVRPYVRTSHKDILCPQPVDNEPAANNITEE